MRDDTVYRHITKRTDNATSEVFLPSLPQTKTNKLRRDKDLTMIAKSKENIKNAFIFDAVKERELKNDSTKKTQTEDRKTTGSSTMDNETYSFKFDDGFYFANFAYTPSSIIDNQLLFKGILGGNGILISQNCVVRSNVRGTKASWEPFLDVRKKLKSVEKVFRANNAHRNFCVPKSALAAMDKTALATKVASYIKGWRPPKEDEFVLIDMYRHRQNDIICPDPMLSAVSHISLKQSKGQSYLTDFRAFSLKGDQVCIMDASISKNIAAFNREHRCNELCEMKIRPNHHSDPISVKTDGFENLITYPVSAPAPGDIHYWNRCPMMPPPPPYSEYPDPTAPSIDYIYNHNYFQSRNMSIS